MPRSSAPNSDWAQLDVTRRSIEETAAAIMKLYRPQRQRLGMSFRDDDLARQSSA
jgi:hypothetical protein